MQTGENSIIAVYKLYQINSYA